MFVAKNKTIGLSAEECAILFEVVERTLFINNQEQFFRWVRTDLQRIFPHGMLVCGIGCIGKEGILVQHVMGCNFPPEYLQILQCPNGLINSPIIAKWIQERRPILFEPDCGTTANAAQSPWLDNFRRFGLRNLAAHGQCDVNSNTASYFKFSNIPGPLVPRHAHLLKLLVPHLHVTLNRVLTNLPAKVYAQQKTLITGREKEILKWLYDGKSNWEIARVLGISEATVKNHVHSILVRLNVGTRTQAVTKALSLKLIHTRLALFLYTSAELLLQVQELPDICCAVI